MKDRYFIEFYRSGKDFYDFFVEIDSFEYDALSPFCFELESGNSIPKEFQALVDKVRRRDATEFTEVPDDATIIFIRDV